jgi:hypothetical protein
MMQLSQREMRERVGMKRRPSPLKPPAPEPAPKYDPSVLRRWRKPEKPIEIID